LKTRSQAAIIAEKVSTYQRPAEALPDPGQYDGSFKKFGDGAKPFRIGEKKETKYDPSLGPGYYQQDEAMRSTLPRSQAAVIKESRPYQKAPEPAPEAGDAHLRAFGSGMKGIDFGRKYEFKVDSNPYPGKYDTDSKLTKPNS